MQSKKNNNYFLSVRRQWVPILSLASRVAAVIAAVAPDNPMLITRTSVLIEGLMK
tara:strand:- start:79 stop:243 length:165 start_codon:yes stop_codon:yes gene_type:complete